MAGQLTQRALFSMVLLIHVTIMAVALVPSTHHPNFVIYILAWLLQSRFYRFAAISTSCVYFTPKPCEVKEHSLIMRVYIVFERQTHCDLVFTYLQYNQHTYISLHTYGQQINENVVFNAGSLKIFITTW